MIDDHAHPIQGEYLPLDMSRITLDISHGKEAETSRAKASDKRIFSQLLLGRLATFLDCSLEEVINARNERARDNWSSYVASLCSDAQIEGMIMDAGGVGRAKGQAELSGVQIWEMSRIETHLDQLIEQGLGAKEILSNIETYCLTQQRIGAVAFKSVIAYRTGLAIDPDVTLKKAQASLETIGPVKTKGKALRDLVLRRVLGLCAETGTPIQIHTGYGDSEISLAHSHPLQLEPILSTPEGGAAKIVLIHGSFPYVRELAYLASVHRNLYAELSLFPLFSPLCVVELLLQVLDIAPYSKVILGTDGHGQPETHYFAAKILTDAVDEATTRLSALGIATTWTREMAGALRNQNARDIYGLDEASSQLKNCP